MSEELQRYRVRQSGRWLYRGAPLGHFEHYSIGSTTLSQLKTAGIITTFTTQIKFKPRIWKGRSSAASKPDELILDGKSTILVVERKDSPELNTQRQEEAAAEQCLTYMQQLGAKLGVVTDHRRFIWIHDFNGDSTAIHYIYDDDFLFSGDYRHPGTIQKVLKELNPSTDSLVHPPAVDPTSLADSVWQTIWLATHEEPKLCLATFVEIFVYKFLSDLEVLPADLRIGRMDIEEAVFVNKTGRTQIDFYVENVRPRIKELFPLGEEITDPPIEYTPGSPTTSIIDGFAFLESGVPPGERGLAPFNQSFLEIIKAFINFGPIINIDSDFKSRIYEKFLKKSVKQQKLGQFLTPRNVVRAIVGMARPGELASRRGAVICDPACGVGGFLLEPLLRDERLKDNIENHGGKLRWRVALIGLEVDRQINILAKANLVIHLAEKYRELSPSRRKSFVDLMDRTFLLLDHDKMLGALEFPQTQKFDLILTNPPYVVKGTRVIKDKIGQNKSLDEYYAGSGTGTESLFLRYIVNSLKPGGRALVIVPTGVLARSERVVKQYIRTHCILDAIISLPERTFYNTPNPTYIAVFTKKLTPDEAQTTPVFAYLVREVGETRDARRFACRSDLPDLVRQFRAFYADKQVFGSRNVNCRLIDHSELGPSERWDIDRFWTDQERLELGFSETSAIPVDQFESELTSTVEAVTIELEQLKSEVLIKPRYIETQLSDERFFKLIRGRRVTKKDIHNNPGGIPVISGHREAESYLGEIAEGWLRKKGIPIYETPLITVNANGSVGDVFLRTEPKYAIHDDVIGIEVVHPQIYPLYAVYAIRESVAKARFRYDAKLYMKRLRPLRIRVPVDDQGEIDFQQQQALSAQYERLETLKRSVQKFAADLEDKFITTDFSGRELTGSTGSH